jgi:aspartate/methionine/tyrosine aminotransferase
MKEIKAGKGNYPFTKTTQLNIGNPQSVGQGIITFNREVLAGLMYLPLAADNSTALSVDAKNRVKKLSTLCTSPMGAYTGDSKGYEYVRETVADFINKRDGLKGTDMASSSRIYLGNGASEACRTSLQAIIRNDTDGVLVPIP